MLIAIYPLIGAIVGALLFFAVKSNPDLKRFGELLLFASLVALMFALAAKTLAIG